MFHVLWYGTVSERLEIKQTGITPPFRITSLNAELALYLVETLAVYVGLHSIPYNQEVACFTNSIVVFVAEFVPECAATLHSVVPRYVVEPRQ